MIVRFPVCSSNNMSAIMHNYMFFVVVCVLLVMSVEVVAMTLMSDMFIC